MKLTGEILITLALVVTTLGSLIHDWNKTHVFNPEWTAHARFHAASGVAINFALGLLGLGLLARGGFDNQETLLLCALIPVIAWGSFFVAILVPGSKAEDHPGQIPRLLGMPINMVLAASFCLMSIAGYLLAR